MSPASISRMPSRLSVVSVPLTPNQLMVTMEALRMARVEILKAAAHLKHIYPESIAHAEQLASYAESMGDTLDYLAKVNV